MHPTHRPIGVFDSGIGGLSVLQALLAELPHEQFVYLADNGHAPYGEKTDLFVRQRSLAIADHLVNEHRIKALVVACNTLRPPMPLSKTPMGDSVMDAVRAVTCGSAPHHIQAAVTPMPLNSPVAMRFCHSAGPVMWALVPPASTATVTGMSTTSNS